MLAAGVLLPLLPGPDGVPCPLRSLTGVPCPLCGMTTSVEEALRAHFGAAAGANPFGFVAILAAVLLLAFRPARLQVSGTLVLFAALASWIFELHRFAIL
ncbi:MAG: hypothetical protein QOE29_978 [Gaiellaceae bacterium]|nr:hypothetical protein [Gaiellaceae bacterium]